MLRIRLWALPAKMDTEKLQKTEWILIILLFFRKRPHLFHGSLDNEPLPIWWCGERTKQPQGGFAPAQAYHIGSSLSSNASTINAQQVLVCKRRQPIKRRLGAHGIVICLDIWKYISLRFSSCSIVLMMYKFAFETAEKVFCNSVVVRIPLSWHTLCNVVFSQCFPITVRSVLCASVAYEVAGRLSAHYHQF